MSFHTSKRGEIVQCDADPGKCPLGGQHYETEADAEQALESRMSDSMFAPGDSIRSKTDPSKMKLSELNQAVKDTEDSAILDEGIVRGSTRTHKNMLKNANLTGDQVIRINAMSEDAEVQKNALYHKSFPVGEMSDEEFAKAARKEYSETRRPPHHLESNDLNDDQLDAYVEASSGRFSGQADVTSALRNPNNNLSEQKVIEHGSRGWVNMNAALASGKYPASEIKNADDNAIYWGNVDRETNSENLKGYGEWVEAKRDNHNSEYIGQRIARNPNAPKETMDSFGKKGIAPVEVYSNPNTSESVRKELRESNPEVARKARLMDLEREHGDIRKQIVTKSETTRPYSGAPYSTTNVQLDKKRVEELNLSREEVNDLMGSRGYNAGSSYDPVTGRFTGQVDSSG